MAVPLANPRQKHTAVYSWMCSNRETEKIDCGFTIVRQLFLNDRLSVIY
ncbi:MAG: hypothetical protein F6K17_33455 [Okeania sp. SIO3C4]|nr:hypothetical protein [Okeania sp. SIO3C4]